MATFTATANSDTTLGWAKYGSSSWSVGSGTGARQGVYGDTFTKNNSRVGVIVLKDGENTLAEKRVSSISLTFTNAAAGPGGTKTLYIYKAKYQSLNTTVKGSAQVGELLGKLGGKFYNNTITFILDESTNSGLFANLKAYLEEGNTTLVIFDSNPVQYGDKTYSESYTMITEVVLTAEYDSDVPVYYHNGTKWIPCVAYCYTGSEWKKCIMWYRKNDAWIQV